MKKFTALAILCLCMGVIAKAQTLTATSFELRPMDISARTAGVKDLNGQLCAMIRVALPVEGCKFEGNILKSEFDVNEYLVYVSQGTKMMRIKCPGMAALDIRFDEISEIGSVESGSTYAMNITGFETLLSSQSKKPRILPKSRGFIADHEYVDLGLPSGTIWATVDVGSESVTIAGPEFSWGSTVPQNKETPLYIRAEQNAEIAKAIYQEGIYDISGDPKYDPAAALWGDDWCMPSGDDFIELIENCKITEDESGHRFEGPNGNSIFIPNPSNFRYHLGSTYAPIKRPKKAPNEIDVLYHSGNEVVMSSSDWKMAFPVRAVIHTK